MAYYAALASLVQLLDDIILHHRYPTFLLASHPLVKSLHHKFTSLEESLQHYSSNGDELYDRLEGRIRDVAYRAQDIIELEISNQSCLQESTSINRTCLQESTRINRTSSEERIDTMKKRSPMSCFGCFRGKKFDKEYSIVEELQMVEQETSSVVEKIQMVEQETNSVLEEMMAIKERQQTSEEDSTLNWDSPTTSSSVKTPTAKNIMVGFDEALNIIKDHLCGQSPQLQVISIVGMGGIGKTTLARNTFDDALVEYYFDYRVWVTVSQDYHENKVLQIIYDSLESLIKESPKGKDGDSNERAPDLKERIYKRFKGRRYLIVLDDIWGTKVWEDVRRISPNDRNGSRIMLTTRLLDVAQYANPSFIHEMQFLNGDESWNLLQKKVFAEESCPPELKDIGMLIASKCCGLPLAVVLIAGILSHSKTLHHWKNIAGKVLTMLGIADDEHLNTILSLSYHNLSHQLKACFLYLGSFPEDYEIDIANLVRLWIADGFLKSNDSSKILEKAGEECIEDLVKRNLVLVTKKRPSGQFKICILHDVVREFCRQRAFSECFFHVMNLEGDLYPARIEKVRRINYNGNPYKVYGGCSHIGELTRSVNFINEGGVDFNYNFFALDNVKLLRVFNSYQPYSRGNPSTRRDIPIAFFRLFHLRYFSFRTPYPESSIFMLQNLQTVTLDACLLEGNRLPTQIWKLTQLRHLISPKMRLPSVPRVRDDTPVEKLECLQTLMTVAKCKFPEELIQMIPNLRKLKAHRYRVSQHNIEELRILDGNCLKNLVHLPHLEELKIRGYRIIPNLDFPLTLKKLSLVHNDIPWRDMTMVGSLPNLQVLKLGRHSFVGEEWEPIEGEFMRLKFLQFEELMLKHWQAEYTHFPCLEYLRIIECQKLEIPLEIGDIPSLKVIEVYVAYAAPTNSAIQIQKDQRDKGNDELQVFINTKGMRGGKSIVFVQPKVAHSQRIAMFPCPWRVSHTQGKILF